MTTDNKHYSTVIAIPEIDTTTIEDARRQFFLYKDKRIVEAGCFDGDKWMLTNERDRRGLDFSLDEKAFKDFSLQLHISEDEFKLYLKVYIVCNLGALSLTTLQHLILAIKRTVYSVGQGVEVSLNQTDVLWLSNIIDFFSMLPSEGRETALDSLLEHCEDALEQFGISGGDSQRTLASFESYFRFSDIVELFWKESDDESEKLFYFPIWLWWNVTGVVPMRPHEFILTPRNCLQVIDGKNYLTVRKNKTKGSSRTLGYKISEDYKSERYQIPEKLAKEIKWYLKRTENCIDTDIHTLLVREPHYSMWERSAPRNTRYFTYVNLCTCLRYFYQNIIQDRYGYHVLYGYDGSILPDIKDIEYIHLGDTRHISLINLMAEGASPVAAMVLAGHDNPEMSAHYYANVGKLIECRVQRQYRKTLTGSQVYSLSSPRSKLCVGDSAKSSFGGYCYSQKVQQGDYSDCYLVSGPAGELGFCPNCDYYRDNKGFHDSKEIYLRRIKTESEVLEKIVKEVRRGRGDTEDIVSIINRLSGAAYSYEQYLLETKGEQNVKGKNNH